MKNTCCLFRLIFLVLWAFLCVSAQVRATDLSGEWAGNIEAAGKSQFIFMTIHGDAGKLTLPLDGFSTPLTSLAVQNQRVVLECNQIKLVLRGTIAGDDIEGEAAVPGTSGVFHLTRMPRLDPEVLKSFGGAYRFRDGRFVVVDIRSDVANILVVTDVKSGDVRAYFPRSENQFFSGPALFVTSPVTATITFRRSHNRVEGIDLNRAQSIQHATRVAIREEAVRFQNGAVTLSGTLLLPQKREMPHRAVVFTHGGGPAAREFFWGLGYLFAARGVAVLAYDKRGVGGSNGNWRTATFEDLADDALAGARYLQSRPDIERKGIGFWGLSQGGWIAPLAAARFPDSAFAIALSGGGLSPAEQELFDTEYELSKAGFSPGDVAEALAFQRLKNEIIQSSDKWEQYAAARAVAKDKKWYRVPDIDVRGPERIDDPAWANLQRYYFYNPSAALRSLNCPLLIIFGDLDTPKGVKANVRAIREMMLAAGKRDRTSNRKPRVNDFLIKVYPNGRHNLMEVPKDPTDFVLLKRFVSGLFETMVEWSWANPSR
jgi:pimeloyl-ACP methyl ester carboxylesterase